MLLRTRILGVALAALAVVGVTSAQATSAPQEIPGVDNYYGILKLSGCSGAIVRYPHSVPADRAMAMTNGHCVRAPREVGAYVADKPYSARMTVLGRKAHERVGTVRATKLLYATMSGSDVALIELDASFEDIQNKYNINPLVLSSTPFAAGDQITITSGGWGKQFKCTVVDPHIYRMKEGESVWADSISYTKERACTPGHGTSGSPMQINSTGEIRGILNTGSDNGERCTHNNPCEITREGKVIVNRNVSYGQQIWWLLTCVDEQRRFSLSLPGCKVTGGTDPIDLTLPPGFTPLAAATSTL